MKKALLLTALTWLGISVAGAQPLEPSEQLDIIRVEKMRRGQIVIWQDPKHGCKYFITGVSYNYGMYISPPTIRLRADGKPDCPEVK